MRKLLLVLLVFILPLASAYSFTFSTDNYNITEMPAFAWADMGNTSFRWNGYLLNTSDYLYWAGALVSALGNCTFDTEIALVDGEGRKFYVEYGTSETNGTLYMPLFESDLYGFPHYNLSRGPYSLNITLNAKNCEIIIKRFVFVTSKRNPRKVPLMAETPGRCLGKEPEIGAFEFANKTYWREFELNFTYIYTGGYKDVVSGWKSSPCPIFSINNGSPCLSEDYCTCYREKTVLSPGMYKVRLSLRDGNLSIRLLRGGIVFEKSVHVRHPLYLASLGESCSGKIVGNVSFRGVEGNPSELFETSAERQGNFLLAAVIVIVLVFVLRWRR
ncbi:hypothetical protein [Thermococcus sp.]